MCPCSSIHVGTAPRLHSRALADVVLGHWLSIKLVACDAEHTWGLATTQYPAAFDVWANKDFREALKSDSRFQIAEESWERQFLYIPWAMQALSSHPEHASVAAAMQAQLDSMPQPSHAMAEVHSGRKCLQSCAQAATARKSRHLLSDAGGTQAAASAAHSVAHITSDSDQEVQTLSRTSDQCTICLQPPAGSCAHHNALHVLQNRFWYMAVNKTSGARAPHWASGCACLACVPLCIHSVTLNSGHACTPLVLLLSCMLHHMNSMIQRRVQHQRNW